MADIVDAVTRSRMMAGIRGKHTKPELSVRRLLHAAGYRFSLHGKSLPGRPDIVLRKHKAVVFVNGCFWHAHHCPLYRLPKTRTDFWQKKVERNRSNDRRAVRALRKDGWRVATVWECALKGRRKLEAGTLARRLGRWIESPSPTVVIAGKKS